MATKNILCTDCDTFAIVHHNGTSVWVRPCACFESVPDTNNSKYINVTL